MKSETNKPINNPKPKSTKDAPLVPEVQKQSEKEKNSETEESGRIYYNNSKLKERPISSAYPVIDNDLARDNIENDLSDADLQSL